MDDRRFREVLDRVLKIGSNIVKPIDAADRSTADVSERTTSDSLASASIPEPGNPPRVIGPYRLLNRIGVGGMGVVYRAVHTRMNRQVAIKLLPSNRLDSDQASRRFEREMQAVGRLNHRNIVSGYDAGEGDGHRFLAMELLEGVDLGTLCKMPGVTVTIADACELIRQAALGIGYAHQNGIVHRDVKPTNIMLCADGRSTAESESLIRPNPAAGEPIVKLLDLGLARFEQPDPSYESMTSMNQIMGTIDYMSPEQCLDSREVDDRSDIYSLGATLFQLLTGRAPWGGAAYETQGQKLKALLSEKVPSIKSVQEDLPEELVAIVDRSLQRDPNDRFQCIGDMVEALARLAKDHDLKTLFQRVLVTREIEPPGQISTPPQQRHWPTRPPGLKKPKPASSSSQPPRPFAKWLALAGLPLVFLIMGILWLKTDGGYIRIEADDSIQVSVEILKLGRKIGTVEIGKDNSAYWYRSGQYEIRLPAEAEDKLEIVNNHFKLVRGGYTVATISLKTNAEKETAEAIPTRPEQITWPKLDIVDPEHLVTSLENDGPGSLRDVIEQAEAGDVIGFDKALAGKSIKLEKQLKIEKSLTIDALPLIAADRKTGLTIDGSGKSRVFSVSGETTGFILRGVRLTNGDATRHAPTEAGGLVSSNHCRRVMLSQCYLDNGIASAAGGVFIRGGKLFLENCVFRNNEAAKAGGAVYLDSTVGRLTCWIRNCTFFDNRGNSGGAIWCRNSLLRVTRCTFTKNETILRTGIEDAANWNASGGAFKFISNVLAIIEHCTIVDNRAAHVGGGISNSIFPKGIVLKNSVVANNQAESSCPDLHDAERNSITLSGGNLIGVIDGSDGQPNKLVAGRPNAEGDFVGTPDHPIDPMLAPLGDFGGFVQTMRVLPDSPLIDAAVPVKAFSNQDARGVHVPIDGNADGSPLPDIGAVEFDPARDK